MYLVTSHAGDCWQTGACAVFHFPGAFHRKGFNKIINGTGVKHAMATQTIEIKLLGGIVGFVQKDMFIINRMPAREPIGKLGAVADFTSLHGFKQLIFCKSNIVVAWCIFNMGEYHACLFAETVPAITQCSTVAF